MGQDEKDKMKEEAEKSTVPLDKRRVPAVCGRLYADSLRRAWIKDLAKREDDERHARLLQENSIHHNAIAGAEDAFERLYNNSSPWRRSLSLEGRGENADEMALEANRPERVTNSAPDSIRFRWQHQLHNLHKVRHRGIQEKQGQVEYSEIEELKAISIHRLEQVNGRRRRTAEIEKTYEQAAWGGAQDDAKPAYWSLRHAGKGIDPSSPTLFAPASPMCNAMFAVSPNALTFSGLPSAPMTYSPQSPAADLADRMSPQSPATDRADRRPKSVTIADHSHDEHVVYSNEESFQRDADQSNARRSYGGLQSPVLAETFRIGSQRSSPSSMGLSPQRARYEVYSPSRSPPPYTKEAGDAGPIARLPLSPRTRGNLYDDNWANDGRIFAAMPCVNLDCTRVPTRVEVLRRGNIGYPIDLEWHLFKSKMACLIQSAWRRAMAYHDERKLHRMTQAAIVMQRMFRWRRRVFKLKQVELPSLNVSSGVSNLEDVMAKRTKVLTELTKRGQTSKEDSSFGQKGWKEYVMRLHREVAREIELVSPRELPSQSALVAKEPAEPPKKKKAKGKAKAKGKGVGKPSGRVSKNMRSLIDRLAPAPEFRPGDKL